ncbi:MAG: tRNA pseudouridine(55) synthase TruB [Bacilli bacterium]|nr:tRNA pseudouridine(55) synthase TruB [Bacilli bacterium]
MTNMDDGLLLIDKEEGVTSRYVDNAIQRLFHTRKVGHLGTLDPFATGLLIVAVNKATKYLQFLPDEEKTYQARLILGKKTATGDKTGEVIDECDVPNLDQTRIQDVLSSFLGESTQIPPMTSAIKIDGVALYKLAHKGKEIERQPRLVSIHEISLLHYEGNIIDFRAKVSKGTYIRTLGEDIASALGTVGYLESLRRLEVGNITLEGAKKLSEVDSSCFKEPSSFVVYPRIHLPFSLGVKARNGVKLTLDSDAEKVLLEDEQGVIAIYEKEGQGQYHCLRGL